MGQPRRASLQLLVVWRTGRRMMIINRCIKQDRRTMMTKVILFILLACFGSSSCSLSRPMTKMKSTFDSSVARTVGRNLDELKHSKTLAFVGEREPVEIRYLDSGNLLHVYDYWKGTAMIRDGACLVYLEFEVKTMIVLSAKSEGQGCYTNY